MSSDSEDDNIQLFAASSKKSQNTKINTKPAETPASKNKKQKKSDTSKEQPKVEVEELAKIVDASKPSDEIEFKQEVINDQKEQSVPSVTFGELGISDWLSEVLAQMGIKNPTLIQKNAIPQILHGKNVLGTAQTGSGKTAAFALPILTKLADDPYGIFAVVLTPTRELAIQIEEQFSVFGKPLGIRTSLIIGGMSVIYQAGALSKKPHIVIATPGRLADFIESKTDFSLKKVKFLVLDEADRLLDSSYNRELKTVLSAMPPVNSRQTLLFSATLNADDALALETNSAKFMSKRGKFGRKGKNRKGEDKAGDNEDSKEEQPQQPQEPHQQNTQLVNKRMSASEIIDYARTKLEGLLPQTNEKLFVYEACVKYSVVETLQQEYLFMPDHAKDAYLYYVLKKFDKKNQSETDENTEVSKYSRKEQPKTHTCVVFVSTCQTAEFVYYMLKSLKIAICRLHSDMDQGRRTESLSRFRANKCTALIATDVASRGLDIPEVELVINYNLPLTATDYVHRVGRTARAGRNGLAITLLVPDDIPALHSIEGSLGKKLTEHPNEEKKVFKHFYRVSHAKADANIQLSDMSFGERKKRLEELRKNNPDYFEEEETNKRKKRKFK